MALFRKIKGVVNITINDHVIRVIKNMPADFSEITEVAEYPLPEGLLKDGRVLDEMGLFEIVKDFVKELDLKNLDIRFYVPNALVIMRPVSFPANLKLSEVKGYFQQQIGKQIHLPFDQPLMDIYVPDENEVIPGHIDSNLDTSINEVASTIEEPTEPLRPAILFAAQEAEVSKYIDIFEDAKLRPIAIDVEALGVYRYFHFINQINVEKSYLFVELSLLSINLSIFRNNQLEFMRYQQLDIAHKDWYSETAPSGEVSWYARKNREDIVQLAIEDQIIELERIMNFYRYSQHKGEKQVTDIVIHGDYPMLGVFAEEIQNRYGLPVTVLQGYLSKENNMDKKLGSAFVPVLGLALKGGITDASRSKFTSKKRT